MPFLLALIAIGGAAYFWVMRARNAADAAHDLLDVANDVRLAARRFGFKRQLNSHPVDALDEANVACVAIAVAFLEVDGLPTQEQRDALLLETQSVFNTDKATAEEMFIFGRWLVNECNGADAAITRLSRRLYKINQKASFEDLMVLIKQTLLTSGTELSDRQRSSLQDISVALKM